MTTETMCPVCGHDHENNAYNYCHNCGYQWGSFFAFSDVAPRRKKSKRTNRHARTNYQREVLTILFAGGAMGKYGNRYRVWDKKMNPLRRFSSTTFLQVKKFCRKNKKGLWVINLKLVRSLRRNTWVKRYYLSMVINEAHKEFPS